MNARKQTFSYIIEFEDQTLFDKNMKMISTRYFECNDRYYIIFQCSSYKMPDSVCSKSHQSFLAVKFNDRKHILWIDLKRVCHCAHYDHWSLNINRTTKKKH